jgi:hypothetical protein
MREGQYAYLLVQEGERQGAEERRNGRDNLNYAQQQQRKKCLHLCAMWRIQHEKNNNSTKKKMLASK